MPAVLSTSLPIMPPNPQQDSWRAYFSWMDDLVQKTSSSVTGNRSLRYGSKKHPEAQRLANGLISLTQQMHRISVTPITTESLMDNGNNDHLENASMSNTIVCNVDDVFLKLINYFRNLTMNNDRLKILDLDISVKTFYGKLRSTLWREADKCIKAEDTSGLNIVAKRLEQTPQVPELPEYDGLNTNWENFRDWFRDLFTLLYPPKILSPQSGDKGTELDQAAFDCNREKVKLGIQLLSTALKDLSNAKGIAAIERTDYQFGNAPYLVNSYREGPDNTVNTEDIFPHLLQYLKELQQVVGGDSSELINSLKKAYAKFASADQLTTGHSRFEILEKITK